MIQVGSKGVVDGQQIFDGSHVLAADFGARELTDVSNKDSIDWSNRYLYAADGTTIVMSWSTPTELNLLGNFLITSAGNLEANNLLANLWDGTHLAINQMRQLIANNGSTVALDWTDPTKITVGVQIASFDGNTYFDNSGFHGSGASITGVSASTVTGTTTNDNAAAGNVGQEIESLKDNAHTVSLTTATAANVTSISLTAGDWDVEGNVNFTETTSTVTARSAGISTTSATLPTDGSEAYCGVQSTVTSETNSITLPRKRVSIASTTTVYLVGKATFSAGTCAGFGAITARRVR